MDQPPEWLWYGEDDKGNSVVTFGRWPKHGAKWLYVLSTSQVVPIRHRVHSSLIWNTSIKRHFYIKLISLVVILGIIGGTVGGLGACAIIKVWP